MIEQLIEWGKDKEDLEEMNSNELKRLYEELYDEFERRPGFYPNIDTEEEYEEEMEQVFSRFVDN